ncbi:leucine-rich repeat receptor-like tyrosine-protein kinase PXC3 [Cocos nucifera]|uniref:Leucine-rich repeat receptor-like tyrosine-protein kinase PXC3 n=1 Tax=Cocos nucifera TaxID=13894 RepID=A0A8K0MXG3_COCNU|nr:leucine-rich repeat receptor-like tyrosine-protein kinase PXC3 [Cocos nucifera]
MNSQWVDSLTSSFTTNPGEMERYAHVFLLSFLFFFSSSLLFGYGLAGTSFELVRNQKEIMRNLSQSLPTSPSNRLWNTTNPDPCHWSWVVCSRPPPSDVTGLALSGRGLGSANASVSYVFDLLCRLNSLECLDLSNNSLTIIPKSCSGLSKLKSLNLSYNNLKGSLPTFSSLESLESLDLSFNHMEGDVGPQLDRLRRLRRLNLSANSLNGTIPVGASGGKFPSLEALVLSINHFQGEIRSILDYKNLTLLDLGQNNLNGSIPDDIERLSKLKTLILSSNNLTGKFPVGLAKIKTLSWFAANQNNFSASVPPGITDHVKILDLSYNSLTGKIPSGLLSPPTLKSVDLTSNQLEGPIPENFSQSLYRLRLGGNSLNGSIPPAIGRVAGLTYLELDGNHLSASIPPQLGNCTNLTLLNLASNQLQGRLPEHLGNLQQLVVLKLQGNNLSGDIPNEFFTFGNLSTLNLSQNSLSGKIPSAISSLKKLQVLDLQINRFSGSIPNNIIALASLNELQLGNNKLSGSIPDMPTSLSTVLNLTSNLFSGPIPSSLSKLSQLEVLDLSNNYFSGEVPNFLTQIQSLTELVLSNNQLSGVLPKFPKYVNVIAGGNQLINSTTSSEIRIKRKINASIIIAAIISAAIGLGLVAAVLRLMVSKQFYWVEDEGIQPGENLPRVINGSFITANGIHSSSIDFAKTMEIVSNPSNIIMKTRFSTYYKATMPNEVSYHVKKLNWTDKIFQMGSHERFGQELEVLGRLSSSNVMVPLAYVLTVDSAYLFYENVHKGTVFDFLHDGSENALDWPSRYSIALGVAQGLTFLHGCNQPVLLLDLSTRSIHLKSVKEPQIGDIELCKAIDPSKSTGSLSTVAGSVGYIPPEYAYTMRVTMPGNVYSFGVILLELLPENHQ